MAGAGENMAAMSDMWRKPKVDHCCGGDLRPAGTGEERAGVIGASRPRAAGSRSRRPLAPLAAEHRYRSHAESADCFSTGSSFRPGPVADLLAHNDQGIGFCVEKVSKLIAQLTPTCPTMSEVIKRFDASLGFLRSAIYYRLDPLNRALSEYLFDSSRSLWERHSATIR